ncbi:MAG: hypothetical protein FWC91_12315 [Defluviitaleaceae bacterium]|nr:hypothetical protein [Defluviitaleaceae bacterium]
MKKRFALSLLLAMVMIFSIIIPSMADSQNAGVSTMPYQYQYQVEWQEEHYRYLVELDYFSAEFQDIVSRMDEVDKYILAVIDQMMYENYEADLIVERIKVLLEKYMMPLDEMMGDIHVHASEVDCDATSEPKIECNETIKENLLLWVEEIRDEVPPWNDIEIIFCDELGTYVPHLFTTIDIDDLMDYHMLFVNEFFSEFYHSSACNN